MCVCVCIYQSKDVWSLQDALLGLGTREAVQMNSGTVNEVSPIVTWLAQWCMG